MMDNSSLKSKTKALVTYESKASPRAPNEDDIKTYVEKLQDSLARVKFELKEYKKVIETYRSEIVAMQRQLETLNNDNLKQMVPVIQHDTEFFN